MSDQKIVGIRPNHYVHVINMVCNTNINQLAVIQSYFLINAQLDVTFPT